MSADIEGLREVLAMDKVRLETTFALSVNGSLNGLLISGQNWSERKWTRFDTAIFPNEGETLGALADRLLVMREQASAARYETERSAT